MRPRFLLAHLPFALLLLTGCSSAFVVKSDPPQADVYVVDAKTGDRKELGKTPLEMKTSAVKSIAGSAVGAGDYFTVSVEKQDFLPQTLLVPASRFGTLVTQLDVKLKQGTAVKEEKTARSALDHLFLAQRLAVAKQYERALIELDKLQADFPDFPRALSMRASIFYLQKNYPESVKWYEAALKADPQMEDAVQMLAKAKTLQTGGRVPASGGGGKGQ